MVLIQLLLLPILTVSLSLAARPLLTELPVNVSDMPDCQDPDILSCVKVRVDFEAFRSEQELEFPTGVVMEEKLDMGDSASYEGTDGSSAAVTYDLKVFELTAAISLASDRLFNIVSCGFRCYLLIEEGRERTHAIVDHAEEKEDSRAIGLTPAQLSRMAEDRQNTNKAMSTVDVMFYTTRQYRRSTSNPRSDVQQWITNTNVGYANSKVNVRVRMFCIEDLDFDENNDADGMLARFRRARGSERATLNSADVAVLLLSRPVPQGSRGSVCGIAYLNAFQNNQAFGWIGKGCQITTMGHEIGHMFGAFHNVEIAGSARPVGGVAYGYLMRRSDGRPSGYASIMAYPTSGYRTGINYYSSPDLSYNGVPTGTNRANVRSALLERRGLMSGLGDESGACRGIAGSAGSATPTTTTATPTDTTTPSNPNPNPTCRDYAYECSSWSGYCRYSIVQRFCQRTCNVC